MRIQNNITAINSHRVYTVNSGKLAKNVEKLSSGYRINRAGDDAAGLAISEKMRAQIRGLSMASKNSQDAISLIQTAEGALQSSHDILQRMRELAVQSASDTNETSIDRNALNLEFQQLIKEIDDIANKTVFNDQKLIDGTFSKNILASSISIGKGAVTNKNQNLKITGVWVGVSAVAAGATKSKLEVKFTTEIVQAAINSKGGTVVSTSQPITLTANGVSVTMPGTLSAVNNVFVDKTLTKGDASLNGIWQLSFDAGAGVFIATNQNNGKILTAAAAAAISQGKINVKFGDSGIKLEFTASGTISNVSQIAGLSGSFVVSGAITKQDTKYADFVSIGNESVRLYEGATNVAFQHSDISFQFEKAWIQSTAQTIRTGWKDDNGVMKIINNAEKANLDGAITVFRIENKNLVIQTGANQGDETAISLDRMDAASLGIKFADIAGRFNASAAITQVNGALNIISTQRATLGALQNRLEFKIANLDTSAENLQAAEARIRDTDMAKEMTAFMKNNILFQASTAMLAQANSLPQGVLQLLG